MQRRNHEALELARAVRRRMEELDMRVFQGHLSLNIVGLRTPRRVAGLFDDWLCVFWRAATPGAGQRWRCTVYPITTSPSAYYLRKPVNAAGTANLIADRQWRGAYVVGQHGRTKYPALVQRGATPVDFTRDNDGDNILDGDSNHRGYIGTNIHASSSHPFDPRKDRDRLTDMVEGDDAIQVWSAGCQVFADSADYRDFWRLVLTSAALYGSSFTYTLLELTESWTPRNSWLNLE